jgi:hypothetical protein
MRKNNFTTSTQGILTTHSRPGKYKELSYSSKINDSRKFSNFRTTESRIYNIDNTKKPSAVTTTAKHEAKSIEKQDLGTAKKRTRNSTIRGSNYQEKEYIVAIIENYAREVNFSVTSRSGYQLLTFILWRSL